MFAPRNHPGATSSAIKAILLAPYAFFGVGLSLTWLLDWGLVNPGEWLLILLSPFIYWIIGPSRLRAALEQFRGFLVSLAALSFIGLLGTLNGAFFINADLMLQNVLAVFRLLFYGLLVFYTATLVHHYRISIHGAIAIGLATSCILNITAWVDRGMEFESLPGQNTLGFVIALGFPYILYRLLFGKIGLLNRTANLGLVTLVAVSALLTWSKGTWLGILIITCVMLAYWGSKSLKKFVIGCVLVTSVVLITSELFGSQVYRLVETEMTASAGSASNEMRATQILNGVIVGLEYPLGVGNKSYYQAARGLGLEFVADGAPPDPHNAYAHVMSGFGAVGLVPYLLIMTYPLTILWRARRSMPANDFLMQASILISIYFQGLVTGEVFTQPLAWALIGSCLGFVWMYTTKKPGELALGRLP